MNGQIKEQNNSSKQLMAKHLRITLPDLVISRSYEIWIQYNRTIIFELGRGWDIPR